MRAALTAMSPLTEVIFETQLACLLGQMEENTPCEQEVFMLKGDNFLRSFEVPMGAW